MKFKTYKSPKRFGVIIEAYDLQGDEEISFVVILFGRGFRFLFEPKKRLVKHFEFRLPPTAIVSTQEGDKIYKTKVLEWH